MAFIWGKHFVTGIDSIDAQHQQLVTLINAYENQLSDATDLEPELLEGTFAELAAYAHNHFMEEESLMAAADVVEQHATKHRREHARFLNEVGAMKASMAPDDIYAASSLLKFLTHWLAYHILGADQLLAKQIAHIEAGMTAEDAYAEVTKFEEGATGPLLTAVDGLFQQVRERNAQLLELNRTLDQKVQERTAELFEANSHLDRISKTDQLTGLPNRRFAMQQFALLWQESVAKDASLACAMIDADNFKQINDNYGHDAGDLVLKELSRKLQHCFRTDDFVARLGGDEFLVLLPNTPLTGAMNIAEQVRAAVADLHVIAGEGVWDGSISVGVAERLPEMQAFEQLIKAADGAVYISKANGRNRVECARD